MLILSRRPNESICFPSLGISVRIFGVQGSRVRVGVDAPVDVQVLRGELTDQAIATAAPSIVLEADADKLLPYFASKPLLELKKRIRTAIRSLHIVQRQLAAGQSELAEQSLTQAIERLSILEQDLVSSTEGAALEAVASESSIQVREAQAEYRTSANSIGFSVHDCVGDPWFTLSMSSGKQVEYLSSAKQPACV